MTHLNMTVEIDVYADDEWGSSKSWVETRNKVMKRIESAVLDLFEYPISAEVTLERLCINGDDTEE